MIHSFLNWSPQNKTKNLLLSMKIQVFSNRDPLCHMAQGNNPHLPGSRFFIPESQTTLWTAGVFRQPSSAPLGFLKPSQTQGCLLFSFWIGGLRPGPAGETQASRDPGFFAAPSPKNSEETHLPPVVFLFVAFVSGNHVFFEISHD